MSEQNWGVGNEADSKSFATAVVGKENVELIFGEHPHSRQDNNIYARYKNGEVQEFDGHRLCFKIEIEEYNYLKTSGLSGNEIRKGCSGKLFVNGVQCYDTFHRNYDSCYQNVKKFISDMEMYWSWFPFDTQSMIGKIIGYREQLFKIDYIIVDQGSMILKTVDGRPRKRFLWEDEKEFEPEDSVKVEITSDAITWYPKTEKANQNGAN